MTRSTSWPPTFGLNVANVAVPEVILSPDVQAGLDEIVRKRLQTEQAHQDLLRVKAEAEAEQESQQGEIRIATEPHSGRGSRSRDLGRAGGGEDSVSACGHRSGTVQ